MFNLEEPMVRAVKLTQLLLDCCLPWWSFQDSTLHCADWALAAEIALNLDRQCCTSDGAHHQSLCQSVSVLTVVRVWTLLSRHHTGRDPIPLGIVCFRQSIAPRFDMLQGCLHLSTLLLIRLSFPKLDLGFVRKTSGRNIRNFFLKLWIQILQRLSWIALTFCYFNADWSQCWKVFGKEAMAEFYQLSLTKRWEIGDHDMALLYSLFWQNSMVE